MLNQKNTAKSSSYQLTFTDRTNLSTRALNASIGSVMLGETVFPNPYTASMLVPGNTLEYNPITLRLLSSENMSEWVEMYKWMIACTRMTKLSDATLFDRMQMTVLNLQNVPIMHVVYTDVWPTALGDVMYTIEDEETTLSFDATFRFTTIEIEIIATGEKIKYAAG
jgi:hypothetical protein